MAWRRSRVVRELIVCPIWQVDPLNHCYCPGFLGNSGHTEIGTNVDSLGCDLEQGSRTLGVQDLIAKASGTAGATGHIREGRTSQCVLATCGAARSGVP